MATATTRSISITRQMSISSQEDDEEEIDYLAPITPTNIGHLLRLPTEVICPACEHKMLTRVEKHAATCVQQFLAVLNCLCCNCIGWRGRHDINHYCSKCGCYIGRYITLSWYKKLLFKKRVQDIENQNKLLYFKKSLKERKNKQNETNVGET